MNSALLARLGQQQPRTLLSRLGKRKRGRREEWWICGRCCGQRRGYGGDSVRGVWGGGTLSEGSVGLVGEGEGVREGDGGREKAFWRSPKSVSGEGREGWVRPRQSQQQRHGEEGGPGRSLGDVEGGEESMMWEGLEQVETGDEGISGLAAPKGILSGLEDNIFQACDYASALPQALERGESVLAARCLFVASRANDQAFVRSLSEETFSKILHLLEPANALNEFATIHLDVSESARKHYRLRKVLEVAHKHSELLMDALYVRRSVGMLPTFKDYKVLLRGARDLGDLNMAKMLWRYLEADGYVPDTECHNHRMASYVENGKHILETRHKLRVTPFHMLARKTDKPAIEFQNYSVKRAGRHGIRDMTMELFRDMNRSGAPANEETFCIVMTAAAREGEMSTVKSILRRVWNIDVDALVATNPGEEMAPKSYERDSPLHPTDRLLHAVAHAFSINNDMAMAMRLTDLIARTYNVEISQETWAELTEWVFVLSAERTGRRARTDGTTTGQLDKQAVQELWDTMTGAPYFVRPTMGMYHCLIRSLTFRDMTGPLLEKVEEALRLQRENVREAGMRWEAFKKSVEARESGQDEASVSLERHLREWETADLIRARDQFWAKQWMTMLLVTLQTSSLRRMEDDMALREVPRVLGEYGRLLPSRTWYQTKAGLIDLSLRSPRTADRTQFNLAVRRFQRNAMLERAKKYVGDNWMRREDSVLPKRMNTPEMLDAVARTAMQRSVV